MPETLVVGDDSFQQKMLELKARFIQRAQSDAATIRTIRTQMASDATAVGELSKQLIRTVHGLAGAAGVFGFTQISNAAHIAEMRLRQIEGVDEDPDGLLDELEAQLTSFRRESTS